MLHYMMRGSLVLAQFLFAVFSCEVSSLWSYSYAERVPPCLSLLLLLLSGVLNLP